MTDCLYLYLNIITIIMFSVLTFIFSYVNQKTKNKSDPSTRRADYSRVCAALKRLGFPQEATNTIWRVLSSVLHLGNLSFESKENEGTEITNQDVLKKVGSLLQVASGQELEESLTGRVIAAHGEIVRKLHNVDDAVRGRDAFAKVPVLNTRIGLRLMNVEKYCISGKAFHLFRLRVEWIFPALIVRISSYFRPSTTGCSLGS